MKIDASEASTFTSLSTKWWDPQEFKLLRALNPLRLEAVSNLFKDESPEPSFPLYGKRILDIGCGGGILSEPLSKLGAKVLGIDMVAEGIEAAKNHLITTSSEWKNVPFGSPEYRIMSSTEVAAQFPGQFDAVIASEVLEHVSEWKQIISDVSKCLKPGGHFVATTVNRTYLAYWLFIVVAEDVLNMIPRGSHTWEKFIEPTELCIAASKQNLQPQKVAGMTYFPPTNEWKWSRSQAINYTFWAVKVDPNKH
ncbi:hypothetical protein Aperf_G00000068231 [Anoplocephala perfoliata]